MKLERCETEGEGAREESLRGVWAGVPGVEETAELAMLVERLAGRTFCEGVLGGCAIASAAVFD